MLGVEFKFFLKRLSDSPSVKWNKSYSAAKLSIAVIRATNLCLRGGVPNRGALKWRMAAALTPFYPDISFYF